MKLAPTTFDADGLEVPGNKGYKYFGKARELPGVKEILQQEHDIVHAKPKDYVKAVNIDYYGIRDEEDGELLRYEKEMEASY